MKNNSDTPAVESVGSKEQGNTQTQGKSGACDSRSTNGTTETNKHTVESQQDINDNNDKSRQQKLPGPPRKGKGPRSLTKTADRQKRTGQWRNCCARRRSAHKKEKKKAQSSKNSAAKERMDSEPTLDNLMSMVNKEYRFTKETDKRRSVGRNPN